jgi:hypothetical protein
MLSQKFQSLDSFFSLQVSLSHRQLKVGDTADFKTFKNPMLTISDLKFPPFSDISLEHKIFRCNKTGALSQISKVG